MLLRVRWPTEPHERNRLFLRQSVVGSEIGFHDVVPSCKLVVGLLAEVVKHVVILLCGSGVGAGNYAAKGDEQIVDADWVIKHILSALRFGLNECLFYHGHLLIE